MLEGLWFWNWYFLHLIIFWLAKYFCLQVCKDYLIYAGGSPWKVCLILQSCYVFSIMAIEEGLLVPIGLAQFKESEQNPQWLPVWVWIYNFVIGSCILCLVPGSGNILGGCENTRTRYLARRSKSLVKDSWEYIVLLPFWFYLQMV